MTHRVRAWLLHAGQPSAPGPGELVLTTIDLPDLAPDRVLVEPVYGCWGGNMTHAIQRVPADIARQRGEPWVVLGNAAVVRVLEVGVDAARPRQPGAPVRGPDPADLRPGRLAMLFSTAEPDRYGYPIKALAYDAVGTMGCLAERMIVRPHELIFLPESTRHALPRWAAFAGSSITAWSNWELAHGTFRLQIPADELPAPHVWAWGGGTSLAELDLARRHGALTVQLSSDPARRDQIARTGVTPLVRDPALSFDEPRFAADLTYRRAYLDAETAFLREVERRTDGEGVHIFLDYLGLPVYRATMKALAREGVITSAGWKLGMVLTHLRAAACIRRQQFINTHYARYPQGLAAVAYAEAEDWLPEADPEILGFDEIPEVARRHATGEAGLYPTFSINPP